MVGQGELESLATVRTWIEGMEKQWGEPLSSNERAGKLKSLADFVDFVGRNPDEIISECLIVRGETLKISVKGRRMYSDKIAQFQEQLGLVHANNVRSFLIYNGILLQTPVQG